MVSTRSTKRQSPSPPAPNPRPTKSPRVSKQSKTPLKQDFTNIQVVLLDIEGTICPITFVKDTLFPYALKALPTVLATQWDSLDFKIHRNAFPEEHRASPEALEAHVKDLTERDVKIGYLKDLQGYLWEEGYKSGAYSTPVYADVLEFFDRWPSPGRQNRPEMVQTPDGLGILLTKPVEEGQQKDRDSSDTPKARVGHEQADANAATSNATTNADNSNSNSNSNNESEPRSAPSTEEERERDIVIYSSGSIFAQQLLFQHIDDPTSHHNTRSTNPTAAAATATTLDLRPRITTYFDTTTAGPKTQPKSYTTIAASLGLRLDLGAASDAAPKILFLSDSTAEVYAALEAGMRAVVVEREGNKELTDKERGELDVVREFGELGLGGVK